MSNHDQVQAELTSWKEIAAFLDVSIRTAQTWELEKGLPVHRMPGSGSRVSADPEELANWKTHVQRKGPWWVHTKFRAYYAAVLPLLLIAAVGHDIYFHHWPTERMPSSYRLEWNQLVVLDKSGSEMWRKKFEGPLHSYPSTPTFHGSDRPVVFEDLDGDGSHEVLFIESPREFGCDVLHCFSGDGREQWRFVSNKESKFESQGALTHITNMRVGRLTHATAPRLTVLACRLPDHSSRLSVLTNSGEIESAYTYDGHLDRLDIADVERDGTLEIVLGGMRNRARQAELILLHPTSAALPTGRLTVEASILFPRTALGRSLADQQRVVRLQTKEGSIEVGVAEVLGNPHCEVCYRFNHTLSAVEVSFCDSFLDLRKRFEADEFLSQSPPEIEIERLRSSVKVFRPLPID